MTSIKLQSTVVLLGALLMAAQQDRAGAADTAPDAAAHCAALSGPSPHEQKATWHPAGEALAQPFGPPVSLPAHCEVTSTLQPRSGVAGQHYAIHFRLRLPEQWNGGFFFEGGGGTEGDVGGAIGANGPGMPPAIARGYAVVSQDAGHDNATNSDPKLGGAVSFGADPVARANYGGAALKPVAEAAKKIIRGYYGQAIRRSYFFGCSKGGQEGMAFAQRYPEEFDGIVAGAPGFALPRAAIAEVWDTKAFASLVTPASGAGFDAKALAASFGKEQFAATREAVLAACDADDGARDGITAAIGSCTWPRVEAELRKRACASGTDAACLSTAQIEVLQRIYGGPKDSHGKALYSDWPLDGGAGSDAWRMWKIGSADGRIPGINLAMGVPAMATVFSTPSRVLPPEPGAAADFVQHFDFDKDAQAIYVVKKPFAKSAWDDISARSDHLERFRAHGGKLIVTHGASDPVFSLNDTLAWYRDVDRRSAGQAAGFVRVFPVPGMAHCGGGPSTDQFDAFGALVNWVEHGTAPEFLPAKAGPGSPWPGRTRPLCAYPKIARYSGSGSLEEAVNFRCE